MSSKYGTTANASANSELFAAAAQAAEKVADIIKGHEGKQLTRRLSNAINAIENVTAYIDDGIPGTPKALEVHYNAYGHEGSEVVNDWTGHHGSVQLVYSMRADNAGKVPTGYHTRVESKASNLWTMSMQFEAIAECPGIVKNAKERIGVFARQMNDYIESLDPVLFDLVGLDGMFVSELGIVARYF